MELSFPTAFFANFHFLRPWWLLALLPVLVFLAALWHQHHAASAWQHAIDRSLLPYLLDKDRGSGRRPALLLLAAWGLCVLALAGPVWRKLPQPVQQRQDALVIVLDLSLSMYVQDHQPNRIDLARRKLRDVLNLRSEGQTGLVVYAGDAHIVTPLTDDVVTISAMVPALEPNIMPLFGSEPVLAVDTAIGMLDEAAVGRGRILLMTDGIRDLREAETLARRVNDSRYQLLVMGIGTEEGGGIRTNDGGYLTDERGQVIIPVLDRDLLRTLANRSSGRYHDIQLSDSDLEYLLTDYAFFEDERMREAQQEFDLWQEPGPWLLLLVLPLAALGFRRGWLLTVLLTGTLLGGWVQPQPVLAKTQAQPSSALQPSGQPSPPQTQTAQENDSWRWRDLWRTPDQQGARAFAQQDYATAAGLFDALQWQGAAAYRAEDYQGAVSAFSGNDSASANYNRGNALTHAGFYDEAIAAFDRALELNPDLDDARANRAIAEELRERQQQEQGEGEDGDPREGAQQEGESQQESQQDGEQQQSESGEEQSEQDSEEEQSEQEQQSDTAQENESAQSGGEQEMPGDMSNQEFEEQQELDQWLNRIPDEPGELLARKFRYQYRQRQMEGTAAYRRGDQIW